MSELQRIIDEMEYDGVTAQAISYEHHFGHEKVEVVVAVGDEIQKLVHALDCVMGAKDSPDALYQQLAAKDEELAEVKRGNSRCCENRRYWQERAERAEHRIAQAVREEREAWDRATDMLAGMTRTQKTFLLKMVEAIRYRSAQEPTREGPYTREETDRIVGSPAERVTVGASPFPPEAHAKPEPAPREEADEEVCCGFGSDMEATIRADEAKRRTAEIVGRLREAAKMYGLEGAGALHMFADDLKRELEGKG